jgi:hypothetical protein
MTGDLKPDHHTHDVELEESLFFDDDQASNHNNSNIVSREPSARQHSVDTEADSAIEAAFQLNTSTVDDQLHQLADKFDSIVGLDIPTPSARSSLDSNSRPTSLVGSLRNFSNQPSSMVGSHQQQQRHYNHTHHYPGDVRQNTAIDFSIAASLPTYAAGSGGGAGRVLGAFASERHLTDNSTHDIGDDDDIDIDPFTGLPNDMSSAYQLGTSMPIRIPSANSLAAAAAAGRRRLQLSSSNNSNKGSDGLGQAAAAAGATTKTTGKTSFGFIPPHLVGMAGTDADNIMSQGGVSPSTDFKREKLLARNAILRSTGFLEATEGAALGPTAEVIDSIREVVILKESSSSGINVTGSASSPSSGAVNIRNMAAAPLPTMTPGGLSAALGTSR